MCVDGAEAQATRSMCRAKYLAAGARGRDPRSMVGAVAGAPPDPRSMVGAVAGARGMVGAVAGVPRPCDVISP